MEPGRPFLRRLYLGELPGVENMHPPPLAAPTQRVIDTGVRSLEQPIHSCAAHRAGCCCCTMQSKKGLACACPFPSTAEVRL